MSFSFKKYISNRQASLLQCVHHHLCLVWGDNLVISTLEEGAGAGDLVCRIQGRAFKVKVARSGVRANETFRVKELKFVRIFGQCFKIADSVVADSSPEHISESQARQCSVATSATSDNCEFVSINNSSLNQESSCMATVIHIDHSPLCAKAVAELTAIARRSSVVDGNTCNSSGCEVVDIPVQSRGVRTSRASVRQNTERRKSALWGNILSIGWRVIKSIGI